MTKAIELYTLCANQDNANAQLRLAICYENGDGVEKKKKRYD